MANRCTNWDTTRATTQNGTTDRLFFNDFGTNSGIINQSAKCIDVHNASDPDDAGSKPLRIAINLLSGEIGTSYRTVYPGGSISIDGNIDCIAYEGIGGTPDIEITYGW